MKIPQLPPLAGMTPLGVKPKPAIEDETALGYNHDTNPFPDSLFNDLPFNLAGEPLDNSVGAEGEARVRALDESEARKAQIDFIYERESGNAKIEAERLEYDL